MSDNEAVEVTDAWFDADSHHLYEDKLALYGIILDREKRHVIVPAASGPITCIAGDWIRLPTLHVAIPVETLRNILDSLLLAEAFIMGQMPGDKPMAAKALEDSITVTMTILDKGLRM